MSKPGHPSNADDPLPAPPADFPARKDYSVETVAALAIQLLPNNTPERAAKEAIKLLDACRGELAARAKHAELLSRTETGRKAWWDKYVPTEEGETFLMPWKKALLHITNYDSTVTAQPRFKKFYAFYWQQGDAIQRCIPFEEANAPESKQIEDRIAEFQREGMDSHLAGILKEAYEKWSRIDAVAQAQGKAYKKAAKVKAAKKAAKKAAEEKKGD